MAKKKNTIYTGLRIVFGLLVNLIIVIILIEGFSYAFHFTYRMFGDFPYRPGDTSTVTITILADSSSMDVIDQVYDSGVIEDKYVFMAKTYLEGYYKSMKPDTYELSPSMTNTQILQTLTGQLPED